MAYIYTESDYNGYIDSQYRRYGFFADRGITFNNSWNSLKNETLLVAGCGWGFLVQELMQEHGFTDVWGCDASDYAVNTAAPANLPSQYASRILLGSILSDTDIKAVANTAGIQGGNPKFKAILTEDVLPCLTDAEIPIALSVLRGRSRSLAHIITPRMQGSTLQPDGSTTYPGGMQVPELTWLTHEEWIAHIGSNDPIAFTDTTELVNV